MAEGRRRQQALADLGRLGAVNSSQLLSPACPLTGWRTAAHRRWGPGARRWRSPSPCGLRGRAAGRRKQMRRARRALGTNKMQQQQAATNGVAAAAWQAASTRTEELAAESESLQDTGPRCGAVSPAGAAAAGGWAPPPSTSRSGCPAIATMPASILRATGPPGRQGSATGGAGRRSMWAAASGAGGS